MRDSHLTVVLARKRHGVIPATAGCAAGPVHTGRQSHAYLVRLLTLILCLLSTVGCGSSLERSEQARPLPLADRDPRETGRDADRWPQWRGHQSAGVASGGSPAIQFGKNKGVRWTADVPGTGNSSPVVWGDLVLLTSALDDTDPASLAVIAFSRTDGSLLWQAEAGRAKDRTHTKNGYASATVATDGRRIVAFLGSAGLFCCDLSGKRVWHVDLGDLDHIWGTAASPIL